MLDACAEIVDEAGYEGLTTTLLAERAGVAIGSVYQFFPDKRAVVQALTQRNLAAYLLRLTDRVTTGDHPHWWDAVDAGIDEYIHLHRTVPGFGMLALAGAAAEATPGGVETGPARRSSGAAGGAGAEPTGDGLDHNGAVTARLAELLVARFELPDTSELRFALAIAVEAADALIKFAFRRDRAGDAAVLAEAKALIREYLHRYLAAPAGR
jgi:AcrR family transcriptional regulator